MISLATAYHPQIKRRGHWEPDDKRRLVPRGLSEKTCLRSFFEKFNPGCGGNSDWLKHELKE